MALENIISDVTQKISGFKPVSDMANIGHVLSVQDGVVTLDGLSQAKMAEKIVCLEKNIEAMILNIKSEQVGGIVLGDFSKISQGDVFTTTGEVMSVAVSEDIVGRVIDAIGNPVDGINKAISTDKLMPIEKIAPGVIDRQPVKTPVQTGVLAVDSMIPIGRGQRELIIGDRNTGKTAIAVDAIINQRDAEDPMICIYVAIGQKNSRVAQLIEKLKEHRAMDYTIVVNASASDSVALQYIAPYSATAIGEYFLDKGKDVLIIYDDLTKHAWAYRQLSLVLRRPPGREAYPGDIFYLHSRLLERACRLKDELGGGSITSLPIVETQFGDVSAYIPTNIISITDGQIFLETDLFNAGYRPAIDAGNSVSRVGGSAQIKTMKKVAGQLRLDLAQFKELEAFAQFGSADLDESTRKRIKRGERIRELLKQPQYEPLHVNTQIAMIYALNEGYLDKLPLDQVADFKEQLKLHMRSEKSIDPKVILENFAKTYDLESEQSDESN